MEAGRMFGIPADAMVLLIGASGSGKSTFAEKRFEPTQVLSSDAYRALVSDDSADQRASADAFRLLHGVAAARLQRGRLTVVDATNVMHAARSSLLKTAARFGRPAVAIVFDLPLGVALARNAGRVDRRVSEDVIRRQHALLQRAIGRLPEEGYQQIHVLRSTNEVDAAARDEGVAGGR